MIDGKEVNISFLCVFSSPMVREKNLFAPFFALFFFAKKKRSTKEKTTAYICLLASNVLPLTLRVSRFTLIPAKIYDIKK